jgi:hypothetical protein
MFIRFLQHTVNILAITHIYEGEDGALIVHLTSATRLEGATMANTVYVPKELATQFFAALPSIARLVVEDKEVIG